MKFSFAPYTVPPDNYRWKHPVDGTPIESSDRKAWYNKIEQHYKDQGYPLPADWKEQAEDQLCRMLPPGWCLHDDGRMQFETINNRLEIGDFYRGMEVLAAVVADPEPFVSQEIAEQRARVCASCPANIAVPGCHSCHKFSNIIAQIKGIQETAADPMLKACAVCKCSNQAQVWVKVKLLERGVTADHMRLFELMPHCWKLKAMQAQDDTAGLQKP